MLRRNCIDRSGSKPEPLFGGVHFRFRQLRTCLPLSLGQPCANGQLSVRLSAYCEVGRVPELGVNLYGRDVHSELAAKLAGEKAFPSRAATAVLYSFLWEWLDVSVPIFSTSVLF